MGTYVFTKCDVSPFDSSCGFNLISFRSHRLCHPEAYERRTKPENKDQFREERTVNPPGKTTIL